jgi:hypothetical protein
MAPLFWDRVRILLLDYLKKGATITTGYDVALLDKLKQQLVSKCWGKLSKGILVLQDKAVPSQGSHYAAEIGRSSLGSYEKHLSYSPDLDFIALLISVLNSKNTSKEERFQALRIRMSGLQ